MVAKSETKESAVSLSQGAASFPTLCLAGSESNFCCVQCLTSGLETWKTGILPLEAHTWLPSLPQDVTGGSEWRKGFPKFPHPFLTSLIPDCWSPIQWALWVSLSLLLNQMQALWSLYQVTVPTPLRLPPTSQRPRSKYYGDVSGFWLPACSPRFPPQQKNASILLPPMLSSCPSPVCHKGPCSPSPGLLSTDSRRPQGKDWGWWGRWVGIELSLDSHRLFSGHIEKTEAQREGTHSRRWSVNGGGVAGT